MAENKRKEPSLETGEGCFELHYDFSRADAFSIPALVGSFFKLRSLAEHKFDSYPVITSVKQDGEKIEIKRQIMYRSFFNSVPYPEETIVIDRAAVGKKNSIVMHSTTKSPWKTEAMKLFGVGYMIKRCLIDREAHKSFTNPKQL